MKPYVLGIVGPPGSGKSTLAAHVARSIGSDAVALPMDGFHRTNGDLEAHGLLRRKGSPESFDRKTFAERLALARIGNVTTWPYYSRERHESVADAITFPPNPRVLIVEGNYLLLWQEIREQLDESWYCEIPAEIREQRLIARHVAGGRSKAAARERISLNDSINAALIDKTKALADRVLDLAEMADPFARPEVLARLRGDQASGG